MSDTTATTAAASTLANGAEAVGVTSSPPTAAPGGTGPDTSADALPAEQHDPADDDQDEGGTDELTRWKRRARDWERRAKRNSDLATRYPDLEARARSLEEQYEEALGARTRAEADLWRERAARAHGIPDDLLEFLTGSSEDEVMQRAERIAAKITGPRRPLPDPTQGGGASAPASPADIFAQFARERLHR
ncbi:hypothetical protein SSP35_03_03160 [Streptomyces sp. NBRC 110611]|uniref:hypothetical protein n=1 Tax=Streptomyces sp. NBRC 110611 TaxID=1621259 RepID=UPI000835E415|nr:hypothetical protein [Streptomyces sp. NBRC 110611]GAU66668.1 hypothetical protein SSP35_03_03160 [Streptomyces sp. NBRC 110611]